MSDKHHLIGDGPIQDELKAQMNGVAKLIDKHLNGEENCRNPRFGFVVLAFPMGDEDGRCNYIGNIPPAQMKYLIVDQADKIVSQVDLRSGKDDSVA